MSLLHHVDRMLGIDARTADPGELHRARVICGVGLFAVVSSVLTLALAMTMHASATALWFGAVVLLGAVGAVGLVRQRRRVAAAWVLSGTVALVQCAGGLFQDGFFVMVSPGSVAVFVMGAYLIGGRGSALFAALIACGYALVFAAHATGHVIDAAILPPDPRAMLALNGVLGLPAAWFFQRLDRLAKEAADQRLRQAQERLAQTDKMAAVGQLAAGIAHELNNPLAVVLAFAQGLERRHGSTVDLHRPITAIVRETTRCSELVRGLLTFSRIDQRTTELVDLNAALETVKALVGPRAKTQGCTLVAELGDDVPSVTGSRAQLEQVLVNLANNALDAVGSGGAITLRSRKAGGGAVLDVVDTGTGIPPEIRARIFEPFFTTKPVGKGTGLGLSISWELVRQHGGTIDVESDRGRGTTMTVRLPAAA